MARRRRSGGYDMVIEGEVGGVPSQVRIRGEWWRVLWRSSRDDVWAAANAWGVTVPDRREIHLCDSMLAPGMDAQRMDTWTHELMHAALRSMPGRGLGNALEERVVRWVAASVAPVLRPVPARARRRRRRR